MEALWTLEDKWKVSTEKAVALFACTSFLLIALCAAAAVKRMWRKQEVVVHQEPPYSATRVWAEKPWLRWTSSSVKKALTGSVRWSGKNCKWDVDRLSRSGRETPTPLLVREYFAWQSHNSSSPVWQRPILMGEKCELPRFSGLILYDERGRPLGDMGNDKRQEEMAAQVTTTLRDLL